MIKESERRSKIDTQIQGTIDQNTVHRKLTKKSNPDNTFTNKL